jgi:hypothetical protein
MDKTKAIDDYIIEIQRLEPDEQLRLIETISGRLREILKAENKKHHITELEGLGADIWKRMDAQGYVNEERSSWD